MCEDENFIDYDRMKRFALNISLFFTVFGTVMVGVGMFIEEIIPIIAGFFLVILSIEFNTYRTTNHLREIRKLQHISFVEEHEE